MLESEGLWTKAVLWRRRDGVAGTGRYGEANVTEPVEVNCTWVNKAGKAKNPQGESVGTDATVIVAENEEVAIGSLMWEGELDDWLGTGSEHTDDIVMEVVTIKTARNIDGAWTRQTLGLVYYKDTLPNG